MMQISQLMLLRCGVRSEEKEKQLVFGAIVEESTKNLCFRLLFFSSVFGVFLIDEYPL